MGSPFGNSVWPGRADSDTLWLCGVSSHLRGDAESRAPQIGNLVAGTTQRVTQLNERGSLGTRTDVTESNHTPGCQGYHPGPLWGVSAT